MLTLTPDTTIPQPVRALGIANTRRSAAAVLKTRLRRREITLREILASTRRGARAADDLGGAAVDARDRPHTAARAERPRDPGGARQPRRPTRRAHRTPAQLARRPPMPMNGPARTDGLVVVHARDEVNRRSPATAAASTPARRTSVPTRSRSSRCCSNDPSSPTRRRADQLEPAACRRATHDHPGPRSRHSRSRLAQTRTVTAPARTQPRSPRHGRRDALAAHEPTGRRGVGA